MQSRGQERSSTESFQLSSPVELYERCLLLPATMHTGYCQPVKLKKPQCAGVFLGGAGGCGSLPTLLTLFSSSSRQHCDTTCPKAPTIVSLDCLAWLNAPPQVNKRHSYEARHSKDLQVTSQKPGARAIPFFEQC